MKIEHETLDVNSKYYKIYNDIIEKAITTNRYKNKDVYYENHHILPKSLGGTDDKDNLALLTAREHYIVHKLLCKFCKSPKMIYAFWCFQSYKTSYIVKNSKDYNLCKIKLIKILSDTHSNTTFINDGFINKKIRNYDVLPDGWCYGILQSSDTKKLMSVVLSETHSNTMWVNNSVVNRKIKNVIELPIGWVKGRLMDEETKIDIAKKLSLINTGKKCITNGFDTISIQPDSDLPYNWYYGQAFSKKRQDKKAITDGIEQRFIHNTELLPDGWYYGMTESAKLKNSIKRHTQMNITNGVENKVISNDEIVPDGWYKGRTIEDKKGQYVWMTNGIKNTKVKKTDTIQDGYVFGKINSISKLETGIWITNSEEDLFILKGETLNTGWDLGKRLLKKEEYKTTKDKIFMTDGISNKYVNDISEIPDGWTKGCTKAKKPKYTINNGLKEKMISIEIIDIPEGWVKGRIPMSEEVKNKIKHSASNKILITDGNNKKLIKNNVEIPVGWSKIVDK